MDRYMDGCAREIGLDHHLDHWCHCPETIESSNQMQTLSDRLFRMEGNPYVDRESWCQVDPLLSPFAIFRIVGFIVRKFEPFLISFIRFSWVICHGMKSLRIKRKSGNDEGLGNPSSMSVIPLRVLFRFAVSVRHFWDWIWSIWGFEFNMEIFERIASSKSDVVKQVSKIDSRQKEHGIAAKSFRFDSVSPRQSPTFPEPLEVIFSLQIWIFQFRKSVVTLKRVISVSSCAFVKRSDSVLPAKERGSGGEHTFEKSDFWNFQSRFLRFLEHTKHQNVLEMACKLHFSPSNCLKTKKIHFLWGKNVFFLLEISDFSNVWWRAASSTYGVRFLFRLPTFIVILSLIGWVLANLVADWIRRSITNDLFGWLEMSELNEKQSQTQLLKRNTKLVRLPAEIDGSWVWSALVGMSSPCFGPTRLTQEKKVVLLSWEWIDEVWRNQTVEKTWELVKNHKLELGKFEGSNEPAQNHKRNSWQQAYSKYKFHLPRYPGNSTLLDALPKLTLLIAFA